MQSIVWFSGPSAFNLIDVLPTDRYEEFGCNHFNDFRSLHHVIAYDKPIIDAITPTPMSTHWCRDKFLRDGWHKMPFSTEHSRCNDSGTMAVELALHVNASHCWIIGCDWGVTDVSIQDHHYSFRGYQPPKFTPNKNKWLQTLDHSRVTWVHLERQPWMQSYINHSDFLDLSLSISH